MAKEAKKDNGKKIPCALCRSKFVPEKNQKKAQWAATWCEMASGLLCPPCHLAAGKVEGGTALKSGMTLGCLPFGSDILEASKTNKTAETWARMRRSESWRNWVETNHPEWL